MECYNRGRRGHYVRECHFKKEEENLTVIVMEKAPEEVPSEDERDMLVVVVLAGIEDAERLMSPKKRSTLSHGSLMSRSRRVLELWTTRWLDEEKSQDSAEMEVIIEEGDDVKMTRTSIIVTKKTERWVFVHEDAFCQVIHRDEGTWQRLILM
jgi:hypothetical protein